MGKVILTAAEQAALVANRDFDADAAERELAEVVYLVNSTSGGDTNTSLGDTADTPATSNTGTFSIIAFIKRFMSHYLATRTYVASSISTSGDNTVIAAPSAGQRIVITALRIQNDTSTATTVLIKDGASTTVARLRTPSDGSGVDRVSGPSDALRLSTATAFIVNLSAANAHGVSVEYYLETVSTGLPV